MPHMPTPFTHLEIAQRLLHDAAIPQAIRRLLHAETGAFLLGNVAADARVGSGAPRDHTHFYMYGQDIVEHPWRVMMRANPSLMQPHNPAHRAFIAGYVAHLTVDETWSVQMVAPHFVGREWGDRVLRFYMLHIILIYMDERDLALIENWQAEALCSAQPESWLPFASDDDLRAWQNLIYQQIKADGASLTLEILGERISKTPGEMRAFLDSRQQMQSHLWDHIPMTILAQVEAAMYAAARDQLITYFEETETRSAG